MKLAFFAIGSLFAIAAALTGNAGFLAVAVTNTLVGARWK